MINEAQKILRKYYGYDSFRKGQERIISSILSENDTFGIMPTGGGKSICYQVPALMFPGITLVISPLISLMKDQVDALINYGIPASFINSSLSSKEISERIYGALNGDYKILYIAPERLESEQFTDMLKSLKISLLAIDEAHCVSQWGHDFRPSYRAIPMFIQKLDERPVIAAFTATATEEVSNDVINLLELKNSNVYVTGFNRENLSFSVLRGIKRSEFIIDYLSAHKEQSGIIYAATRKEVDKLYEALLHKGFMVGRYHAGLSDEERTSNQEAFIYDKLQVIIATNAFGMGIDKSNVRFVIHYNMPRNMESYYQEAGRAGRDGEPAECIVLYGASDVHVHKFLIEQTLLSDDRKGNEYKKLQDMVDYCHTTGCLRQFILNYFGDEDVPERCDNCGNCNNNDELADITLEAQKIFSCIKRMSEQYGATTVANVLRGSNTKKIRQLGFDRLSTYGIMADYAIDDITGIISMLTAEDYLMVSGGQYPVLKIQPKAIPVLKGSEKVFQRIKKKSQAKKEDTTLFDLLRSLRREISEEEKVPPYVIFHDSTLKEMSKHMPMDRISLLAMPGVGENKLNKYGERFITVIKGYAEQNGIHLVSKLENPVFTQSDTKNTSDSLPLNSNSVPKTPSHLMTMEMYKSGKSLKVISQERDMGIITIQDHVLRCAREGLDINLDDFIPKEHEFLILDACKTIGIEKLKPIKETLPDEIDYFTIKAVICKHYEMNNQ